MAHDTVEVQILKGDAESVAKLLRAMGKQAEVGVEAAPAAKGEARPKRKQTVAELAARRKNVGPAREGRRKRFALRRKVLLAELKARKPKSISAHEMLAIWCAAEPDHATTLTDAERWLRTFLSEEIIHKIKTPAGYLRYVLPSKATAPKRRKRAKQSAVAEPAKQQELPLAGAAKGATLEDYGPVLIAAMKREDRHFSISEIHQVWNCTKDATPQRIKHMVEKQLLMRVGRGLYALQSLVKDAKKPLKVLSVKDLANGHASTSHG